MKSKVKENNNLEVDFAIVQKVKQNKKEKESKKERKIE